MFHRALASATIAFGLVGVLNCSDDDAATGGTVNASQQSLLALSATRYTPDGTSSYVALVPDLSASTAVDYGSVFDLPSEGRIWGSDKLPNTFIAVDNEAATITKYTLDANSQILAQGTLGFEAYGVMAFSPESHPRIDVISAHKAYLFDATSAQAIAFDPSTMVALTAIDLSGLTKDDWNLTLGESSTLLHDGQLIVFGSYADVRAERYSSELRIARIDTEADTVSYLKDERCPASVAVQTSSGDIYFASGGLAAAYSRLQMDQSPQTCLLRLPSGAAKLDDFAVALADLTDGTTSGGLIPAGDDAAYVLSFDEGIMPVTEATLGSDIYGASAWRWWRIELGETTPGTRATYPISTTGSAVFFEVDGQTYANNTVSNNSETALMRTNTDGDPEPGISIWGVLLNVVRMR